MTAVDSATRHCFAKPTLAESGATTATPRANTGEPTVTTNNQIQFGDTLTCAETGKRFIAARDGCTTNYARDSAGNVYSDEGVDIRQRRELAQRAGPFSCYVSGDGERITGWKGNTLGRITSRTIGGGFGGRMLHIRATDIHGGEWYGKGAGTGMCITLRPCKASR